MLIGHGHASAASWSIARVHDEAALVAQRENRLIGTMMLGIQAATMTTGFGASKDAAAHFKKFLAALDYGE